MRLTITLEDIEMEALKHSATRELRPTKEQLRWLLRKALGIEEACNTQLNANSDVTTRQGSHVAAAL